MLRCNRRGTIWNRTSENTGNYNFNNLRNVLREMKFHYKKKSVKILSNFTFAIWHWMMDKLFTHEEESWSDGDTFAPNDESSMTGIPLA